MLCWHTSGIYFPCCLFWKHTFYHVSPRLASPRLASPRLASPRLASPRLASPRLASPRLASPRLASPRLIQHLKMERSTQHQSQNEITKVQDKVSHTILVHKLRRYGIGGRLNTCIDSFLENRQQAVVVGGERSNFMPVDSGVPQGSVVGPCLFLLYFNDLPIEIESKIRLFADDTLCSITIKHKEDQKKLQKDLDSLTPWEKQWFMSFRPQKCYTLSATRKKERTVIPPTRTQPAKRQHSKIPLHKYTGQPELGTPHRRHNK